MGRPRKNCSEFKRKASINSKLRENERTLIKVEMGVLGDVSASMHVLQSPGPQNPTT